MESIMNKTAKEYVNKVFGDKDPELKTIVEMNLILDPEDPEDEEKKQKILNKMRREHIKDSELLQGQTFLIHDVCGNLIPYCFFEKKANQKNT
jgi:hypothetical protein